MIRLIAHAKKEWPSGITTFEDPVHRLAEDCGRQEVTIEGAIEAQNNMMIYAYLPGQHEFGLDPWRYLEGIDPYVGGELADIWFESGACKNINVDECDIRFFVDAKNLNNLAAA